MIKAGLINLSLFIPANLSNTLLTIGVEHTANIINIMAFVYK